MHVYEVRYLSKFFFCRCHSCCFRLPFHKAEKQTSEKPSLVRSPEKLLRANFAGVRHAWVNKPIKAEYSNL